MYAWKVKVVMPFAARPVLEMSDYSTILPVSSKY